MKSNFLITFLLLLFPFIPTIGHSELVSFTELSQTLDTESPDGTYDRGSATFHYSPIIKEDNRTLANSQLEAMGYSQHFSWNVFYSANKELTDEMAVREIGADFQETSHGPGQNPPTVIYGEHSGIPYVEQAYDFENLHIRERVYVKDLVRYNLEMDSTPEKITETTPVWLAFAESFRVDDNHDRAEDRWPNSDWMSKLPEGVKRLPLLQILLPGTHDSSAYTTDFRNTITDSLVLYSLYYLAKVSSIAREYLNDWNITQHHDLYTQLKQGNRFFDFRVSFNPEKNRFYLSHITTTISLEEALKQVQMFVEEHPKEVIVISMKPDSSHAKGMKGKTEKVTAEVGSILGPWLRARPGRQDTGDSMTLNKMVADNKRIVFYYRAPEGDRNYNPMIWDGKTAHELWDNTSNVDVKLAKVKARMDNLGAKPYGSYVFVPATLTPQASDILAGLKSMVFSNEYNAANLEQLTERIHIAFPDYFERNITDFEKVSAVMTDFPTDEFVEMIIKFNMTKTSSETDWQ